MLTRFHKPNIVKDIFTGQARWRRCSSISRRPAAACWSICATAPPAFRSQPLDETKSAEADRNRQWREVGVGAQILRDLGVTSIRHLTSSAHDYKGLSGFGIEIVSNEPLEG